MAEDIQKVYQAFGTYNFTASPEKGIAPLVVQFTISSEDPNVQSVYENAEEWKKVF